eukprot:5552365-Karenia_brevis.AAC.1
MSPHEVLDDGETDGDAILPVPVALPISEIASQKCEAASVLPVPVALPTSETGAAAVLPVPVAMPTSETAADMKDESKAAQQTKSDDDTLSTSDCKTSAAVLQSLKNECLKSEFPDLNPLLANAIQKIEMVMVAAA